MPHISVNYVTARPTRGAMIGLEDTHLLQPTLESLKRQTLKDFEFVCVDILYEKRPEMFEEWNLPFPVKHISARPDWWLENGLWSGAAPRNKGIVAADDETELIIIIDDCCEFNPDFLQLFWDWYEKGYLAMALTLYNKGGRPLYYDDKDETMKNHIIGTSTLQELKDKNIIQNRVKDSRWCHVENWKTYHPSPNQYYGYSALSMDAALRVNGFDENLDGDKALIDVELGIRLGMLGYGLVLDRDLTVVENSHYTVPSEVLRSKLGTVKSNYNIMNLNEAKGRWRANSEPLSEEDVRWVLTHRDPLEKHIPVYPEGSKHHELLMDWAENHQSVFDLRELRLLS